MDNAKKKTPFEIQNIRSFIAFRVFFNARFYYPIFTILFLDFGLSLEQFAVLNAVWAAVIVLTEVPSGALADVIGRRNLLVFAGVAMVLEMAVIGFAPKSNITVLFVLFFINRVLSGMAEAAASGADEALAYDSLMKNGDVDDWGSVLEKEMRYRSIGMAIAMSVGAAVYDPAFMNRFFELIGIHITLSQDITLRFPIYLTLVMSVLALMNAINMKEMPRENSLLCLDFDSCKKSVSQAFKLTLNAGKWVMTTPYAVIIIVSAMTFEHILRMIVTLDSQYFRIIELPEATFGVIGTGLSLLGLFIPRIAKKLAENRTPSYNLGVTSVISFIGVAGMSIFIPLYGLLMVIVLYCAFFLIYFFVSYYLNQLTDSSQRATVLSIKGLCLNGAYGLIGILYSFLVAFQRSNLIEYQPELKGEAVENIVFVKAFRWFPWYLLVMFLVLLIFIRYMSKKGSSNNYNKLLEKK
jgi:MFS family permease